MDTKVFQYVVALADTGSYAKAAKQLYITPQGLSSAVKRLEASIGCPLFKGDHTGVTLTDYGRLVYDFSRSFDRDFRALFDAVDELRRRESRRIFLSSSIGLFNVLPRDEVLRFNDLSRTGAQVEILRALPDNDCETALIEKLCDFALLNNPVNGERFLSVPLHKDMMFLWVPADSPLSRRRSVRADDLAGMELVCLTPQEFVVSGSYVERLVAEPLSCSLRYADEVVEMLEVAKRRGIGAVSPRTHAVAFPNEGYVGVPIEDITWGFSVAYLAERELAPWDEEFLAFLSERATFYC